jgi:hypothetical protein
MAQGISPDEQRWLADHVSQCADCSRYAELSQRTLRALDSFAFDLDPVAALRVQRAIHNRADWMASHGQVFSYGIWVAIFLTIIGSAAMWEFTAWLASRWNLAAPMWQIGFAILWLLPSVLLDLLLLLRGKLIGDDARGPRETV